MSAGLVLSAIGLGLGAKQQSNANKEAVRARWAMEDLQRARQERIKQLEPLYEEMLRMALAPANDTYDPDYLDDIWQQEREGSMLGADQAVNMVRSDFAGRNIGLGSSGAQEAIATVRSNQAGELGRARRDIRIRGAQERKQSADAAEQLRFQRLAALMPALQNTEMNLSAGVGGAMNVANNAQDVGNQSLANMIQALARTNTGAGSPNAGNNRTGSNQVSQSVYQLNQPTNPYLTGVPVNTPLSLTSLVDSSITAPPLVYNPQSLRGR